MQSDRGPTASIFENMGHPEAASTARLSAELVSGHRGRGKKSEVARYVPAFLEHESPAIVPAVAMKGQHLVGCTGS